MLGLVVAALVVIQAQEVRVVDGDTIKALGETWRLTGFDTPETRYARCAREWMLGIVAKHRLEALIAGAGRIEIAARSGRDKYRRRLGALMIDGEDAADIMVREGLARPYNGRGKRQGWCGGGWMRGGQ